MGLGLNEVEGYVKVWAEGGLAGSQVWAKG